MLASSKCIYIFYIFNTACQIFELQPGEVQEFKWWLKDGFSLNDDELLDCDEVKQATLFFGKQYEFARRDSSESVVPVKNKHDEQTAPPVNQSELPDDKVVKGTL